MTLIPKNAWPDTKMAKHYLFFAQTIQLLLNDGAFESFRAPVLGNLMRLKELSNVCDQIIEREAPQGIFNSVRGEVLEYVGNDETISSLVGPHLENYLSLLRETNPSDFAQISRVRNSTNLINKQISPSYGTHLSEKLKGSLSNTRSKLDLLELTRNYVTFLINTGYDKRYIKNITKKIFFDNEIKRAGPHLATRFINSFDGVEREYNVFQPIRQGDAGAFDGFKSFSQSICLLNKLPKALQKKISNSPSVSNKDCYFHHKIKAIDAYSASAQMRILTDTYSSLTSLEQKGLSVTTRPYAFVSLKGERTYTHVQAEDSLIQPTASGINKTRGKSLDANLSSIINNFGSYSRARILVSLKSASLARHSQTPENQITLVWSAFETLFGDPPRGSPRLSFYKDGLLQGILLNYPWRFSKAVFDQVNSHHRKHLINTLNRSATDKSLSELQRFQHFLFNPKFVPFHKDFTAGLVRNPSLLQLVFRFYRRFGTGPALRRSMEAHTLRVGWQIDRIYRARNDFVHSGRRSLFVEGLAVNAFEYYRTSLQAIIYHAANLAAEHSHIENFSIEEIRDAIRLQTSNRVDAIDNASLSDDDQITRYLKIFTRR